MAIKNVELTGTEMQVSDVSGGFCSIKNRGSEVLYASAYPDIVADADKVLPIDPGESALLDIENKCVYLLGTGKVSLVGSTSPVNFSVRRHLR